jgi:hypothetical protein
MLEAGSPVAAIPYQSHIDRPQILHTPSEAVENLAVDTIIHNVLQNQHVLPPITATPTTHQLPPPQPKETELSDSEKTNFLIDNAFASSNALISSNNILLTSKQNESNLQEIVAQLLKKQIPGEGSK